MRTTGTPFCPVCAAHLRMQLSGQNGSLCPEDKTRRFSITYFRQLFASWIRG